MTGLSAVLVMRLGLAGVLWVSGLLGFQIGLLVMLRRDALATRRELLAAARDVFEVLTVMKAQQSVGIQIAVPRPEAADAVGDPQETPEQWLARMRQLAERRGR